MNNVDEDPFNKMSMRAYIKKVNVSLLMTLTFIQSEGNFQSHKIKSEMNKNENTSIDLIDQLMTKNATLGKIAFSIKDQVTGQIKESRLQHDIIERLKKDF